MKRKSDPADVPYNLPEQQKTHSKESSNTWHQEFISKRQSSSGPVSYDMPLLVTIPLVFPKHYSSFRSYLFIIWFELRCKHLLLLFPKLVWIRWICNLCEFSILFSSFKSSCLEELGFPPSDALYMWQCYHIPIQIMMLPSYLNRVDELPSLILDPFFTYSVTILRDKETRESKGVAWIQFVEFDYYLNIIL